MILRSINSIAWNISFSNTGFLDREKQHSSLFLSFSVFSPLKGFCDFYFFNMQVYVSCLFLAMFGGF